MNTNETQEYEIPVDWDASIQAAAREGYRTGVEKMRDEVDDMLSETNANTSTFTSTIAFWSVQEKLSRIADLLIAKDGE
jgi:hypothetical protein